MARATIIPNARVKISLIGMVPPWLNSFKRVGFTQSFDSQWVLLQNFSDCERMPFAAALSLNIRFFQITNDRAKGLAIRPSGLHFSNDALFNEMWKYLSILFTPSIWGIVWSFKIATPFAQLDSAVPQGVGNKVL